MDDLLECNQVLLGDVTPAVLGKVDAETEIIGRVLIEEGAVVRSSRLVGPLIIGAGSRVTDSYVGPFTSIGAGCRLESASIDYSILMEQVTVQGIRGLHGSVIGRHSTLSPPSPVPGANRIVVGDHSRLQIGRR